jgi:hypothetical protein
MDYRDGGQISIGPVTGKLIGWILPSVVPCLSCTENQQGLTRSWKRHSGSCLMRFFPRRILLVVLNGCYLTYDQLLYLATWLDICV